MNNYYRKDAMASSCKQMFSCEGNRRIEGRFNRFKNKKHFKNRTELVRLISLVLSFIGHQNKTFVQGMLIDSSDLKTEIYSEFAITHMPKMLVDTQIYADKEESLNKSYKFSIPTPDMNDNKIQPLKKPYKNTTYGEEIVNKDIDITLSIGGNKIINDLSDLNFTAALSTETIHNSNSKHLKTLPTLENRNELSKPEIRNKLSSDIISFENFEKYVSENTHSNTEFHEAILVVETKNEQLESHSNGEQIDKNITKENDTQEHPLRNYGEDKFQPHQHIGVKNYEIEADVSKNIFDQQQYKKLVIAENKLPHHCGDPVNGTQFNVDITENNNNETLKSFSQTQSLVDLPVIFNHTKLVASLSKMTDDLPNTTTETNPSLSIDSTDFVTQNYSNIYKDSILSVDLHETISKDPSESNETDPLNMEEYNNETLKSFSQTQSLVDLPVIFNHTKLVASLSKMTDDLPNTTTETNPSLSIDSINFVTQNYSNIYNDSILSVDLHETISKDPSDSNETDPLNMEKYPNSFFEHVTETGNANNSCEDEEFKHVVIKKVLVQQEIFDDSYVTTYPVLGNDKNVLQLNYSDQTGQENKSENGSVGTIYSFKNYTLDIEKLNERINSNVLESENFTNRTSIENEEEHISTTDFNENYQTTAAIEQYENNMVKYESKQYPEQDNFMNMSKHIFTRPDKIEDNIENEVDEILWTSGEERILNKQHYEEPTKQEADKSIWMAEKFKNNTHILKKNQNEQLIINENNETNYEKHQNQDVTSKGLKSILETKLTEKNYSEIIPDTNNYTYETEKYENNYNTSLTEPVKSSSSVSRQVIPLSFDDMAATLFEAYPPQDVGQTFNGNLADEAAGVGKALPVSITEGFNRSTIIIVMSSVAAIIFILISVTILIISFQRQHGTLDIEMQERYCGKDDLNDEDAQTFAKLLQVELPPSVAVTLDECEECL